jgi:hypothetical protein
MATDSYDVAILGSNLLSALLAGLLARDHGKRVVRVGRKVSAQRLPRNLDLALLTATRPDTWRLLRNGDAETRALIATIGAEMSDIDVEIHADTDATLAALDHIAHLAHSYRVAVRRAGKAWHFRGVTLCTPAPLKLDAWLKGLNVPFVDADNAALSFDANGRGQVPGVEAGQLVLADDAAVLDLDDAIRPPGLTRRSITMTLLEMRRPGPALHFYPDRGVTLMPRNPGTILARIRGDTEVDARLSSALPGPFPTRRIATARYRTLVSTDGAPVIADLQPAGMLVLTGLEDAAAFFAPALARKLAGRSTDEETRWFAAHDPSQSRAAVAEFVA